MANTIISEGELLKKRIEKTDEVVADIVKKINADNKKIKVKESPYANPVDNNQDNSLKNWFNY